MTKGCIDIWWSTLIYMTGCDSHLWQWSLVTSLSLDCCACYRVQSEYYRSSWIYPKMGSRSCIIPIKFSFNHSADSLTSLHVNHLLLLIAKKNLALFSQNHRKVKLEGASEAIKSNPLLMTGIQSKHTCQVMISVFLECLQCWSTHQLPR